MRENDRDKLVMGAWSLNELLRDAGNEAEYGVRLNPEAALPDLGQVSSIADAAQYQLAAGSFIGVKRLHSGEILLIPDLLGLRPIYFSETTVSDTFTDLVALSRESVDWRSKVDFDSVMHFLEFGYPEPGKTIFEGLYCTTPGDVVVVGPKGLRRVRANENPLSPGVLEATGDLGRINNSITYLSSRLRELLSEVQGPAGVDITGGSDSRLLAAFSPYSKQLKEASCSYSTSDADEIQIGQDVADRVNLKFYFVAAPNFYSSNDLWSSFDYVDGLGDVLNGLRHRKMQDDRAKRGIRVSLSGIGGELFKDYWWLQDFPRYRKKRASLGRLYRLRFNSSPMSKSGLTTRASISLEAARSSCWDRLQYLSNEGGISSEIYDRIYYWEKMANVPVPFVVGSAKLGIGLVAPLLDSRLVQCGYRLPRRQRWMERAHRQCISKSPNPDVGSLRTTAGSTLKAGFLGQAADVFGWVLNKGKRLASKMVERTTGRIKWRKTPNHPQSLDDLLRISDEMRLVDDLKEDGLVELGIKSIRDLDRSRAGRWCNLAMILRTARGGKQEASCN